MKKIDRALVVLSLVTAILLFAALEHVGMVNVIPWFAEDPTWPPTGLRVDGSLLIMGLAVASGIILYYTWVKKR